MRIITFVHFIEVYSTRVRSVTMGSVSSCVCVGFLVRDCRHRSTSINVRLKMISDDDGRIVQATAAAIIHNASVTINEDGRVRRSEVADSYR